MCCLSDQVEGNVKENQMWSSFFSFRHAAIPPAQQRTPSAAETLISRSHSLISPSKAFEPKTEHSIDKFFNFLNKNIFYVFCDRDLMGILWLLTTQMRMLKMEIFLVTIPGKISWDKLMIN